jgi:hypothetical protein
VFKGFITVIEKKKKKEKERKGKKGKKGQPSYSSVWSVFVPNGVFGGLPQSFEYRPTFCRF